MPTLEEQILACSEVTGYPTTSFNSDCLFIDLHGTPYLAMNREVTAGELKQGWWLMGKANGLFVYQMIGYI